MSVTAFGPEERLQMVEQAPYVYMLSRGYGFAMHWHGVPRNWLPPDWHGMVVGPVKPDFQEELRLS